MNINDFENLFVAKPQKIYKKKLYNFTTLRVNLNKILLKLKQFTLLCLSSLVDFLGFLIGD